MFFQKENFNKILNEKQKNEKRKSKQFDINAKNTMKN